MLQIAFRLLGVHVIGLGVMAALITGNPDDNALLRALMGLQAVLTLVCWGVVIGSHHLTAAWVVPIVMSVTAQLFVLVAVIFYNTKKKAAAAQIITRKRVAA